MNLVALDRCDQRMHVVGHDTPRVHPVALLIKEQNGFLNHVSDSRLAHEAGPCSPINVLLNANSHLNLSLAKRECREFMPEASEYTFGKAIEEAEHKMLSYLVAIKVRKVPA
jgi:hypothetical protein